MTNIETIPVVMRNIKMLKKAISDGQLDNIKIATQRLTDIPIIPSLQKFKFMIKSVSTQLNKNINFSVSGDEVTLSKEAVDILQDAFIHLLRNAMIHGIEESSERKKRGKSPEGLINVFCYGQEQNFIEIRINDDGRGIDPKVIKRKAFEKELYSKAELNNMNERDVLDIIFHPNFSQKDQVDEFAGRGIGMDIVRHNLERLGGNVTVTSILGKGTEFILLIKSSFVA
jgi:chemotaxis protein histidine kinase CheA